MFDDLNKARRVALEDYTRLYNDVHGGRYTEDDKAQRDALEKAQHGATNAPRRDLVGILNGETQVETSLEGIAKLRDKYQYPGGHRSAEAHNRSHERFAKSADFNRLHPSSHLSRGSGFDFGLGPEPGRRQNSSFQWSDEFSPPTGVRQVRDARGSVDGDNERGRHFSDGEPESILADLKWLLGATRALIAAVNRKEYARGRV